MNSVDGSILTLNGGSSSIKFAMFAAEASLRTILSGRVERIGMADAVFSVQEADGGAAFARPVAAPDHAAAVTVLVDWLATRNSGGGLFAVGHRIVHGGLRYHQPQTLTPALLEELRSLTPLDPEHLPQEIALAEGLQRRFPRLPQIACFDTPFITICRQWRDCCRSRASTRRRAFAATGFTGFPMNS